MMPINDALWPVVRLFVGTQVVPCLCAPLIQQSPSIDIGLRIVKICVGLDGSIGRSIGRSIDLLAGRDRITICRHLTAAHPYRSQIPRPLEKLGAEPGCKEATFRRADRYEDWECFNQSDRSWSSMHARVYGN